jgi:23S rRNA (adenine2503-C2)-methyltransferase
MTGVIKLVKTLHDPNGIVSKLIFEDGEGAIAEAVAYQFENRGVVCYSVQSGCPVGCTFCGTGSRFIRNLTIREMWLQISKAIEVIGPRDKIHLMCMSMGEPMYNWTEVLGLFMHLDNRILLEPLNGYPEKHFLVSTVGINDMEAWRSMYGYFRDTPNFQTGLQLSLHDHDNDRRMALLGNHKGLLHIKHAVQMAKTWGILNGKKAYFNYICKDNNIDPLTADIIATLTEDHHVTCSVLCNTDGFEKADPAPAIKFAEELIATSKVDISVFDPAGQDTIGGGCGQLLYVQEKLKHG